MVFQASTASGLGHAEIIDRDDSNQRSDQQPTKGLRPELPELVQDGSEEEQDERIPAQKAPGILKMPTEAGELLVAEIREKRVVIRREKDGGDLIGIGRGAEKMEQGKIGAKRVPGDDIDMPDPRQGEAEDNESEKRGERDVRAGDKVEKDHERKEENKQVQTRQAGRSQGAKREARARARPARTEIPHPLRSVHRGRRSPGRQRGGR